MNKKKDSGFIIEAVILAVALIFTLPLRTIQYYNSIEPGTGFYTSVNAVIIFFWVVMAAAVVYFIVSAFLKRKKFELETGSGRKAGCGVLSFLCGFGALISAYQEFAAKDIDSSQYTVSATISSSAATGLLYIEMIFAVLSAVYFIVIGISYLSGKDSSFYKLLALAPVVWSVLRLVSRFTRTVSYVRVSDLLIEMLMLVMFSLFFMAFAQTNAQVNAEGNDWKLAAFGLSGALLALVCFVPRAIITVTGHSDCMYILSRADVSDLAVALFALGTVLTRLIPKRSNIIEENRPAE